MTLSRRFFLTASYLAAILLMAFGVWFFVSPDEALVGTHHLLDTLPLVMGGRYLFFGALLLAALRYQDVKVLGTLLIGFAGLGILDGLLYWSANPWPHFGVGFLALFSALYFFKTGKVAA
ncbi:hypothetical protein M3P21_10605 [Ruegeria sp. 2012CJ41-6]|uniref:DoxX family protein n=1 Tax=Ruegeria spongiae TaxID=2942209 RepID=A0ABT0Q289_9RHOB|nr:DUF4267 domain-containing protein [Ruegeria spongiae]MCL6283981.1 hypothetical protein [Ruegeria spongiae]